MFGRFRCYMYKKVDMFVFRQTGCVAMGVGIA